MGLSLLLSAALINYEVARALRITISILFIIVSIGVMVTVMMQKPVSGNIGTIAGENTQTYAGQNKAKNKESILLSSALFSEGPIKIFIWFLLRILITEQVTSSLGFCEYKLLT